MNTIFQSVTLQTVTCYKCGVLFAMPDHMMKSRREDRESFYCPSGHPQAFMKSRADILEKQVAQLTSNYDQMKADREYQKQKREQAERQASAARGQVTKIKNRIGAGVCPCCTRTFCNLARHMETKHPDYRKSEEATP